MTVTEEQRYVVRRVYNRYGNADFLLGWDILWGPIWGGLRRNALTFGAAGVQEAVETAIVIMAPRPWCVPDFGTRMHVHSSFTPYPANLRDA